MNSSGGSEARPSREGEHSTAYVWYVVGLLSIVNVFNYMDRMALAVLLPGIKADLALSDGQLGLLVGFAFAFFYAICGIPIARWADRGIRRNIVALMLGIWSVMTALSGAAQSFWQLFAARIGVGAGEAGGVPCAQSVLCDYVPAERRPGVLALHNFGLIAGTMVGMGLAGVLGEAIGWRWTFVVLGAPGIVLAIIVRLTLHEPARGRCDIGQADPSSISFGATIAMLWRTDIYRLLLLFNVAIAFVQYGLNQWWPSFYSRSFGLGLPAVGMYLGVAIGVGSGIGLLIGGALGNKAARRSQRLPLVIGAVATLLAFPALLASLFISSATVSIMLVSLAGLLWSTTTGPILATLYSATVPRARATAGAVIIFCSSVLGYGLGPLCVGLLSDLLTASLGIEALRYALLAPVCLVPIMAAMLWAAARAMSSRYP